MSLFLWIPQQSMQDIDSLIASMLQHRAERSCFLLGGEQPENAVTGVGIAGFEGVDVLSNHRCRRFNPDGVPGRRLVVADCHHPRIFEELSHG